MVDSYKILYKGGSGELVEKKSRFIADLCPVSSEEEALDFIEEIRKNTGMQGTTVLLISLGTGGRPPGAATTGSRPRQPENP